MLPLFETPKSVLMLPLFKPRSLACLVEARKLTVYVFSDSFTILGLWVLGLAVSNINESQLQTYESKALFLMTSLQYYCIPGLAGTR